MPTLLEKEIDRAIEGKLSSASPVLAPEPHRQAAPRRAAAPVVRFSPLFAEAPAGSRRKRRSLVALSVAVHVALFAVVLFMPRRAQTIVEPSLPIEIVFTAPVPTIPETTRPPALPKPLPKPKPKPEPRDEPPPPVVTAPKPAQPPVVPEIVAPPVA